jgi:hypothetical protein
MHSVTVCLILYVLCTLDRSHPSSLTCWMLQPPAAQPPVRCTTRNQHHTNATLHDGRTSQGTKQLAYAQVRCCQSSALTQHEAQSHNSTTSSALLTTARFPPIKAAAAQSMPWQYIHQGLPPSPYIQTYFTSTPQQAHLNKHASISKLLGSKPQSYSTFRFRCCMPRNTLRLPLSRNSSSVEFSSTPSSSACKLEPSAAA